MLFAKSLTLWPPQFYYIGFYCQRLDIGSWDFFKKFRGYFLQDLT